MTKEKLDILNAAIDSHSKTPTREERWQELWTRCSPDELAWLVVDTEDRLRNERASNERLRADLSRNLPRDHYIAEALADESPSLELGTRNEKQHETADPTSERPFTVGAHGTSGGDCPPFPPDEVERLKRTLRILAEHEPSWSDDFLRARAALKERE